MLQLLLRSETSHCILAEVKVALISFSVYFLTIHDDNLKTLHLDILQRSLVVNGVTPAIKKKLTVFSLHPHVVNSCPPGTRDTSRIRTRVTFLRML